MLDKSVAILEALEGGPMSLAELVEATGLNRATTHRLAQALTGHGILRREPGGRFALGTRLLRLAAAVPETAIAEEAQDLLDALRTETGESAQLYVPQGGRRLCVAAAESAHGLRTIVRVGELLTMERGSAATALSGSVPSGIAVASVAERQAGVASVSAPVRDGTDTVIAAISVSGPIERLGSDPLSLHGALVVRAARELERRCRLRPTSA